MGETVPWWGSTCAKLLVSVWSAVDFPLNWKLAGGLASPGIAGGAALHTQVVHGGGCGPGVFKIRCFIS